VRGGWGGERGWRSLVGAEGVEVLNYLGGECLGKVSLWLF